MLSLSFPGKCEVSRSFKVFRAPLAANFVAAATVKSAAAAAVVVVVATVVATVARYLQTR